MSGYDNSSNNMSGYNFQNGDYSGQGYGMSTAHGPENPGTNPRYVPPQKRELTFGAMPPIERPVSAMSNTSFVSQALGGVSLNDLMGQGGGQGGAGHQGAGNGGGYDAQRGFQGATMGMDGHGQSYSMGAGGQGQLGSGLQGFQQRSYGGMNQGGFNATGGYPSAPMGNGGYGGYGAGPQGNYSFGNQPMANNQVSSYLFHQVYVS